MYVQNSRRLSTAEEVDETAGKKNQAKDEHRLSSSRIYRSAATGVHADILGRTLDIDGSW